MHPELQLCIPTFARLDEYVGVWSILPEAFRAFWDRLGSMDLRAHVAETKPPEIVSEMQMVKARNGQTVAFLPVTGTLMKQKSSMGGTSTIQLRRDIRQAAADPNVSGILLGIESPGGTVAGTHDLASEIQAARKQKPVWSHVDDLAASAAYWTAAQTEQIFANAPTALVGSIGTLMTVYDTSAMAEQSGVKALVFSTGPIKGAGTPGSKVTDEQAAHFQSIVNGMQTEFDAAVKRGRRMSSQQLADVRTGAVWKATEAQDKRLIDGVQSLGKTLEDLAKATMSSGKNVVMSLPLLSSYDILAFTHNSKVASNEPSWSSVDKTALPQIAFADHGEDGKKSTWKYPHHWVEGGKTKDDNGVLTDGTLYLHREGLNAAWSAAMGGRSGQKASQEVIDHLMAHRRSLGMDTKSESLPMLPASDHGGTLPMLKG